MYSSDSISGLRYRLIIIVSKYGVAMIGLKVYDRKMIFREEEHGGSVFGCIFGGRRING